MTTPYEIPLAINSQPGTPQTFQIQLSSVVYRFTLVFNAVLNAWVMDIADAADNSIIAGIPLVTGTDLLSQHQYLGIPGQLVVWWVGTGQPQAPTFDNLGTDARLYYIPE